MTRYLLATWEGGGNLPPELGLARRLIAKNHSVRVLACPAVEDAARASGCEFSPWVTAPHKASLAPEDDFMRDWEFKNLFKLFEHALKVFVAEPAERYARDLLTTLEAHPADAVLTDTYLFGAQIGAQAARLPQAVLVPNIYMRPSRGVPAFGPGLLPAKGPLGRLRDRILTAFGTRLWRKGLPAINRARAAHGLAPLDDIWNQLDAAERVLVLTSQSFDFAPPELPANVRYVGPGLDDPTWAGTDWTPPWPASNADPLVLVGLSSTYQHQQDAIGRVAVALAGLPVRALVTMGPALAGSPVSSPAPNVVIVPTAPHAVVLQHAAAAITHCGHGTTLRALAAGVPLVCMPMGRDQNDTAARVVARGAGVRIKPTAPAAAIRRAVQTVLAEPRFATGARALRDAIAREATEVDPIALIEQLTAAPAHCAAAG